MAAYAEVVNGVLVGPDPELKQYPVFTTVDADWFSVDDGGVTLGFRSQAGHDAAVAQAAADAAAAAAALAALPDYNGAMLSGFMALETLAAGTADGLLAQFPSFGFAMTAGNGPLAWARLNGALTAGKITQAQHDAVAGALTAKNIPAA